MDRTIKDTSTPDQSGPGSNGNEGFIFQRWGIVVIILYTLWTGYTTWTHSWGGLNIKSNRYCLEVKSSISGHVFNCCLKGKNGWCKIHQSMNSRMKTVYFHDSNKGLSLEFLEGYWIQQKALEEGQRVQQPRWVYHLAMFRE